MGRTLATVNSSRMYFCKIQRCTIFDPPLLLFSGSILNTDENVIELNEKFMDLLEDDSIEFNLK